MLQWRIQSPFVGSILMISAPMSPSIWVANGPCASWAKSATTSPVERSGHDLRFSSSYPLNSGDSSPPSTR